MLEVTVIESKAIEWLKGNNLEEGLRMHQEKPEAWIGDMVCLTKFKACDLALAFLVGYIVKETGKVIPGMLETGGTYGTLWDNY